MRYLSLRDKYRMAFYIMITNHHKSFEHYFTWCKKHWCMKSQSTISLKGLVTNSQQSHWVLSWFEPNAIMIIILISPPWQIIWGVKLIEHGQSNYQLWLRHDIDMIFEFPGHQFNLQPYSFCHHTAHTPEFTSLKKSPKPLLEAQAEIPKPLLLLLLLTKLSKLDGFRIDLGSKNRVNNWIWSKKCAPKIWLYFYIFSGRIIVVTGCTRPSCTKSGWDIRIFVLIPYCYVLRPTGTLWPLCKARFLSKLYLFDQYLEQFGMYVLFIF